MYFLLLKHLFWGKPKTPNELFNAHDPCALQVSSDGKISNETLSVVHNITYPVTDCTSKIFMTAEILQYIFQFLSLRDLILLKQVNKFWQENAIVIYKKKLNNVDAFLEFYLPQTFKTNAVKPLSFLAAQTLFKDLKPYTTTLNDLIRIGKNFNPRKLPTSFLVCVTLSPNIAIEKQYLKTLNSTFFIKTLSHNDPTVKHIGNAHVKLRSKNLHYFTWLIHWDFGINKFWEIPNIILVFVPSMTDFLDKSQRLLNDFTIFLKEKNINISNILVTLVIGEQLKLELETSKENLKKFNSFMKNNCINKHGFSVIEHNEKMTSHEVEAAFKNILARYFAIKLEENEDNIENSLRLS
ncbi:MAG: F-box protein [Gammaproteobacteria bacterium]